MRIKHTEGGFQKMDELHSEVNSEEGKEEEKFTTNTNNTEDEEWKQFIKEELDKMENNENKELSIEGGFSLETLIEKIPVEDLVKTTVNIIKKRVEKGGDEKTEEKTEEEMKEEMREEMKVKTEEMKEEMREEIKVKTEEMKEEIREELKVKTEEMREEMKVKTEEMKVKTEEETEERKDVRVDKEPMNKQNSNNRSMSKKKLYRRKRK